MHAVDTLAHQTLRTRDRLDSLRRAQARTAVTASAAGYEHWSAAWSATESPAAGTSWPSEAARGNLSGDRVADVSKCALYVHASGTTVAGLREAAHLVRGLTHRHRADHLHSIAGGGLAELSARFGDTLVFAGILSAVVLVLAIQLDLLEGATPSS
jgi:hypothetical protein